MNEFNFINYTYEDEHDIMFEKSGTNMYEVAAVSV